MSEKDPKLWESTFGDDDSDKSDESNTNNDFDRNEQFDNEADFDQDSDYDESLSRLQRQKQKPHSNKLLFGIILVVLLAIMFGPVIWSAISTNHDKSSMDNTAKVSVSSKPKKAPKVPKKSKTKTKHVTSTAKENAHTAKANEAAANNNETNAPANSQTTQQPNEATTTRSDNNNAAAANSNADNNSSQTNSANAPANNQDAGNYYIVQPKDNPYRIAVNHGLTLQQLYDLNNLSAQSVLRPGMSLRVK